MQRYDNDDDNKNNGKSNTASSPIFFYTGNESPIEQYINHTGLMWELAPKFNAHVVFVEHRYEGQSLPPANLSSNCMSYASTIQALADYARILKEELIPLFTTSTENSQYDLSSRSTSRESQPPPPAVIAFGGSYGGMLSSWFRFKYPHIVTGAIAASAPIGAFPQAANDKIDSSARVIARGLDLPYPPNLNVDRRRHATEDVNIQQNHPNPESDGSTQNHCRTNLLAAWPLIAYLASDSSSQPSSSKLLQDSLRLCNPPRGIKDTRHLLAWGQSIWFDLAEGSFPYPSSYIPFALLHKKVNLPPWPVQAACWKYSDLHKDFGIKFDGNASDVTYNITYGTSKVTLQVDWDQVKRVDDTSSGATSGGHESDDLKGFLARVRDALSIWYNITKDVSCYDISKAAPNSRRLASPFPSYSGARGEDPYHNILSEQASMKGTGSEFDETGEDVAQRDTTDRTPLQCYDYIRQVGSWEPVCCNDELNLVITEARGLGRDGMYWPPSHPRGTRTYADIVRDVTSEPCPDPDGTYGYSAQPYDLWSLWMDSIYGNYLQQSSCLMGHSNVIFSNGLLDPWSAGGVYAQGDSFSQNGAMKLWDANHSASRSQNWDDDAVVQNITDRDLIALIIPFGGHHTDLMYSNKEEDPNCVADARRIEEAYISKWIGVWNQKQYRSNEHNNLSVL